MCVCVYVCVYVCLCVCACVYVFIGPSAGGQDTHTQPKSVLIGPGYKVK